MYLFNWIFWQKSACFLTGSPVYLISGQNGEPGKPRSSWDIKDFPGRKPGSQGALIELEQPELLGSQQCSSRPERKLMATLSFLDKPTSLKNKQTKKTPNKQKEKASKQTQNKLKQTNKQEQNKTKTPKPKTQRKAFGWHFSSCTTGSYSFWSNGRQTVLLFDIFPGWDAGLQADSQSSLCLSFPVGSCSHLNRKEGTKPNQQEKWKCLWTCLCW